MNILKSANLVLMRLLPENRLTMGEYLLKLPLVPGDINLGVPERSYGREGPHEIIS